MAEVVQIQKAGPMSKEKSAERFHFEASGARKTLLSIVFVILLPFYVSLPAMLVQRLSAGLWQDTIGLGLLALAFTAIMVLLFLQLLFALRARVDIGTKAVALNLPAGQGPTPKLRYQKRTIPFEDVLRVETRAELYGAPLAPVLLRGARVVTREGDKISLGFVNEHDVDTFPVLQIAGTIARRAGIEVDDHGAVRRSVGERARGILGKVRQQDKKTDPARNTALSEEEKDLVNAQHRRAMMGFIGFLLLLVAIGITLDLLGH